MEVCDLCRKAAIKGPGKEMYKIITAFGHGGGVKEFSLHFAHVGTLSARIERVSRKLICGACLKKMGLFELLEEDKASRDKMRAEQNG